MCGFLRYHAAVERKIRESAMAYTFLRPNLFMQGLLAFRETIIDQGRFFAAVGDAKISAVDVRDIASAARWPPWSRRGTRVNGPFENPACCALQCLFLRSRSSFVVRAMLAQTSRTAVYGPVRTVVWQGSAGDRRPYADQTALPQKWLIITDVKAVGHFVADYTCRLSNRWACRT
jgi:hypothetical protein